MDAIPTSMDMSKCYEQFRPVEHIMSINFSIDSLRKTLDLQSDNRSELHEFSFQTIPEQASTMSLLSSPQMTVPPTTPAPLFSFDNIQDIELSPTFPDISEWKLPYVREVGIKACLDALSVPFKCENYKLNPVEFWILDVVVDCLWKMQDEFHFPEVFQKAVLEWVLHCLDLIRDPRRNLSRKQFFHVVNEAFGVAKEKIQTGCELLPTPKELYRVLKEESEEISFTSEDNSSVTTSSRKESCGSYVAVGIDEATEIFKLPKQQSIYYENVSFSPSDAVTLPEEEYEESTSEGMVEFYQPDPNLPERFLSSSSSSIQGLEESEHSEENLAEKVHCWKETSLKELKKKCSNNIFVNNEPQPEDKTATNSKQSSRSNSLMQEWMTYLESRQDYLGDMEKKILINTCALSVVRDFVYDYFSETFQYSVVQLALINAFTSIKQNVNKKWCVPKVLKEELKRPKPKKEKKKKPKKDKKPKKKTKKDKKKSKSKKDKAKKKKAAKAKKEKKHKLTKEEKAELARKKKLQQEEEERLRLEEENRRLLFPLKEATDDDFFRAIFDHWVKPKEKKGKVKKKK